MAREQKPGSGVLFINDKKNDRQPDYTGTLVLDREYRPGDTIKLSAWKKPTPRNHLISLVINNYKADEYPKPVNHDDNEVPF